MVFPKVFKQGADIVGLDAAFEPFNAVHGDHWNTVPIALEDLWVATDINLVEHQMVIGGEVFQMRSCVIAQVASRFGIEQNRRFHVCFLQAAYRSDSGMAHSGG